MHSFILEVYMKNKRLNAFGHTINKRSNTPITKLRNNLNPVHFCAWGTIANKFTVICFCHNVEETGCCLIVLIKKQIDVSHDNFTRDSTFFASKSVTMTLVIVSLRVTTLPSIFSSPLPCQEPLPLFWNISNSPLETNDFQRHFILLIQLKSERKIADFQFF